MSRIVFCFPYRTVGGVSLLFARLAERLARDPAYQVAVVDYPEGYLTQQVSNPAIQRIAFDDEAPVQLPEDAIVIFQSRPDWMLPQSLRIPDTTRLFFWNCHPFNFVPSLPGFWRLTTSYPALSRIILWTVLRGYRNRIVRFIRFMEERRALVFMDKPNVDGTEYYLGMTLRTPDYLPIPAQDAADAPRPGRDFSGGIRLAWVGRIADFKHHVLRHAAEALNAQAPSLGVPVSFTIVGTGEYLDALHEDAKAWTNIALTFIDEIAPAQMPDFLRDNVDIFAGMGTAALEAARLGIPVILLDVFYAPVPKDYIFSWFHTRKGFSVGDLPRPEMFLPGNRSLEELLQAALRDYAGLSTASWEHYRNHHDPAMVEALLLRFAGQSHCRYEEFRARGFGRPDAAYEWFRRIKRALAR